MAIITWELKNLMKWEEGEIARITGPFDLCSAAFYFFSWLIISKNAPVYVQSILHIILFAFSPELVFADDDSDNEKYFWCWWWYVGSTVLLTKNLSMLQFPVESLLSVRQLIHFFVLFNSTLCKTLIERVAIHCGKTFLLWWNHPFLFTCIQIYSTLNVPIVK